MLSSSRSLPWLAALLAGCGSVSNVDPDAAPPDAWQKSCAPDPLVTTVESPDPTFRNRCINGQWNLQAYNGTTMPVTAGRPGKTTTVPPTSITIGTNPLDPSSTFAVHATGSGQQNAGSDFAYAQLTAALNTLSATEVGSVDVRAYTGIQFYAIINTGPLGARLTVGNLYTDPAGGMCSPAGGPQGCFDNPATQLAITTTWTKYQVPFASLVQSGFGNPSPVGAAFPREAITHVRWDIGIPDTAPTEPWELWVDDLTFY